MVAKIAAQQGKPKTKIRERGLDLVFIIFLYLILSLILVSLLYPLIFVVSASISDPSAIMAGKVVLFPVGFSLKAYQAILEYKQIWVGFSNSLFYTVAGTLVNLVVTILAGYALSRKDLVGRNFFMFLFAFTMLFNGGIVPTYLVVNQLGLINTRWALIIPQALSVWNLIIAVTYFRTSIPHRASGSGPARWLQRLPIPGAGCHSPFGSHCGRSDPVLCSWTLERIFFRPALPERSGSLSIANYVKEYPDTEQD